MLAEGQLNRLKGLTAELSNEQLIWTQGFLAGAQAIRSSTVQPLKAEAPVVDKLTKKVSILYGTETGNSKALALRFSQTAKREGQPTKLVSLDQYRPEDLAKEENVLIIISTHGEGEPPASAKRFFDY